MKPMLIALYAPTMQSGKTEVADVLVNHRGFVKVKFADGLKRVCSVLLDEAGLPPEIIYRCLDGDLKEWIIPGLDVTGRYLMQTCGTDWGRDKIHKQLWVRSTYKKLQAHAAQGRNVVIDDLRHENELSMVQQAGGFPVRVIRANATPYSGHSSEGMLDNVPMHELHNNGTLEQLHQAAYQLPELL